MKKVVVTIVLGCALLATSGIANAEQSRHAEPGWGIRPERTSASSPLDFARWLARRLSEGMAVPMPLPVVPTPKSAPAPDAGPNETDEVCVPERGHCPVG
ncbi:MAG: hypothetical protein KJ062_15770 [Thermoanaerobaculia bacterium]|nr:hypothetical protein [Thermoanaerobaculia bacterium]